VLRDRLGMPLLERAMRQKMRTQRSTVSRYGKRLLPVRLRRPQGLKVCRPFHILFNYCVQHGT
jgi:hypothetical protein